MMYLLMNKDRIVATIKKEQDPYGATFILKECIGKMPIGYETFPNLESWIGERKASKHNGTVNYSAIELPSIRNDLDSQNDAGCFKSLPL